VDDLQRELKTSRRCSIDPPGLHVDQFVLPQLVNLLGLFCLKQRSYFDALVDDDPPNKILT
jgi:hypothetical protein